MSQLEAEVLGVSYLDGLSWETLTKLTDVGDRMAGHAGEAEAAEILHRKFDEGGLEEVSTTGFELSGWWRESSTLEVGEPLDRTYDRSHDIIALPGSPNDEVRAELVDAGHGLPEELGPELEGKIALVKKTTPPGHHRWVMRIEKYLLACEHDIAGFVLQNQESGSLPPTGEIGYSTRPAPVPGVGVSAEVGDRLRRYAKRESPTVRLRTECRTEPAFSRNVEGAVGPDTEEEVLVTAHLDSHDISEGARDNGAGCALLTEVGRILARSREKLDTRVRFVAFGAEDSGLHGSYDWVRNADTDAIKCVMNVDAIGYSRTLRLMDQTFEEMIPPFKRATGLLGVPLETGSSSMDPMNRNISATGDAWPFLARGIPAVTVGSTNSGNGRGWAHTHADTLEKIDRRDLRDLAIQLACVTAELASAEFAVQRKTPAEIRDALDSDIESVLKIAGRWPF
jgi:Zn-dependent M28 family amino/carboxypeptidase